MLATLLATLLCAMIQGCQSLVRYLTLWLLIKLMRLIKYVKLFLDNFVFCCSNHIVASQLQVDVLF